MAHDAEHPELVSPRPETRTWEELSDEEHRKLFMARQALTYDVDIVDQAMLAQLDHFGMLDDFYHGGPDAA